jgi:succinate-acetate transporter protein
MVYTSGGKVGGITGLLTAIVGYYVGLAELLVVEKNQLFTLPLGSLA